MKKVLIITYYWPPTGGSGVQRWVKFAKYLPSLGWQPVIYTPENPEQLVRDESLEAEIPAGVEVIKTRISEPYGVYHKLVGRKGDEKGAGLNPINSQRKSWKQRLMLWIRSNFFVPDPRRSWVKPSVKFLKDWLREHPVNIIVTTGPPHSMHLIGLGLHRATGIPWVADFRDPWTKMFFFKDLPMLPCVRRKQFRLEREVLDGASAVVSVSPPVRDDFAAATSTPVHLITNGFDAEDFASPLEPRADGEFRIVHTGLFASDGNPLLLWDELSRRCREDAGFASKLRIRLAGKVDPEISEAIREHGLADNLVLLGYLSHKDSVAELRSADLVLLPLRQSPEYRKVLPGKIFECIASGRPVLGIGPEDSAAATLLRETGAGIMVDWDTVPPLDLEGWSQKTAKTQHPLPKKLGGAAKSAENATDKVSALSREALTAKMAKLLNGLTGGQSDE